MRTFINGIEYSEVKRKPEVGDYVYITEAYFTYIESSVNGEWIRKVTDTKHYGEIDDEENISYVLDRDMYLPGVNDEMYGEDQIDNADTFYVLEPIEKEPEKERTLTDEISDLTDAYKHFLLDKNRRYSDSVLRTYERYGQVSFDVRIEDKKNRLRHQLETGQDITDTIEDIHGYMILNKACRKIGKTPEERKDDILGGDHNAL